MFASFALAVSPLASQKKKARAAEDAAAAAADAIAASKARLDKILADGNAQVDKAKADGDSDMADVRLDASIYDTIFFIIHFYFNVDDFNSIILPIMYQCRYLPAYADLPADNINANINASWERSILDHEEWLADNSRVLNGSDSNHSAPGLEYFVRWSSTDR